MSEHENMDFETTAEETVESTPSKPSKSDASKKAKPAEKKKKGGFGRFMRELRSELKKVAWPTKKQTINNTGVVILMCLIVGSFVWIFDAIAGQVFKALLHLFAG